MGSGPEIHDTHRDTEWTKGEAGCHISSPMIRPHPHPSPEAAPWSVLTTWNNKKPQPVWECEPHPGEPWEAGYSGPLKVVSAQQSWARSLWHWRRDEDLSHLNKALLVLLSGQSLLVRSPESRFLCHETHKNTTSITLYPNLAGREGRMNILHSRQYILIHLIYLFGRCVMYGCKEDFHRQRVVSDQVLDN